MLQGEVIKKKAIKYAILALLIIFGGNFLTSFIGKYIRIGGSTFGHYVLMFISIFIIVAIIDLIIERMWSV